MALESSITRSRIPPPALPGFSHVGRYWDPTRNVFAAKLLPGEYYVTSQREIIVTVLGSCVSACIRAPHIGIGGMNHFMLPIHHAHHKPIEDEAAARYGNFAMERLVNEFVKRGVKRSELEVKVFGGGAVLAGMSDVGESNIRFVRHYLADEELPITAEDLGGPHPRKLYYDPLSGRVRLKKLEVLRNSTIRDREQRHLAELSEHPVQGAVDLF